MNRILAFILLTGVIMADAPFNKLSKEEEAVIVRKGTERPGTGLYLHNQQEGTYICKRCNAPLYRSDDKFDSMCGWPSFDDEISGAVKRQVDADGRRTEILCTNCNAHLGHVFLGEGFTQKNTRHCVNSISMNFIKKGVPLPEVIGRENKSSTATAIFAGGCFWGVEFHFQQAHGVISAVSGYTGGHRANPSYEQVCAGKTGHVEAVQVTFDPGQTDFETLARLFFEIHDPTQVNGQGPDIGEQYRSVIFYQDEQQKKIAEKLIAILTEKGYRVATRLEPATEFWSAENYHQDYYEKKHSTPYCHIYTKRF